MSDPDCEDSPIRLGMTALIKDKRYAVVARVVLSMREEGEDYYWREFELQAPDGDWCLLELDEGRWRLTRELRPQLPPARAELERCRPGSILLIDGARCRVTLVSRFKTCAVEGTAPSGARAGSSAPYLDAEDEEASYSVEWDGDEVECYRGEDWTDAAVAAAFR